MTIKQELAAKKKVALTIESGGKEPTMAEVMREVGYAEATVHSPSKLTESKGWNEALEKYLPDDKLLRKHDEALEANRVISAKIVGANANESTDDFIEVPDHPTRLKAVELGYKLKRKLGPEIIQQFNTENMEIEFIGGESK